MTGAAMPNAPRCACAPDCPIPYGTCHCGCGAPTPRYTQMRRPRGEIRGQPKLFLRHHQTKVPGRKARLDFMLACNGPSTIETRLAVARDRVRRAETALWRHPHDAALAAAVVARRRERDAILRAMRVRGAA